MKRRAGLILVLAAGLLVWTAGVSWAGPHGGVAATVAPDGTVVFSTTSGPATTDIAVSAASYIGLWKTQTEPQRLFKVVHGTIAAGTSRLVLHVQVPSCGPYQVDAFLGTQVPATITFPVGSGPNGLMGQEYPNGATCPTSTPTPTPTASVSSTATATATPTPTATPSTGVLGEKLSAGSSLPATGSAGLGPATALGVGLLFIGLALVATARRARRH
jgi:LPXTG-motif cell wall-anchored protein